MKRINQNLAVISFIHITICQLGYSYTYNPQDWLNLPMVKTIHSITADAFNDYIGTPDAIFVFNKLENRVIRTLTSSDGITGVIRICAYDRQSGLLWIVADNKLIGFNPNTNFIITLYPDFYIRSLGVGSSYLYFQTEDKPQRMKKKNRTFSPVEKPDTNVIWYGARKSFKVTDYSFLVPYFYIDENLIRHNITVVFEDRRTLWVGVDEYGVLTYDLITKQQIARWRLGANIGDIYKIFNIDNELWFAGTNGYAQYTYPTNNWNYYSTPFGAIFSSKSVLLQPKILDLRRINGISALVQASNDYWISSGERIFDYDAKSNVLTPIFTFPYPIQNLSISDDDIFFIAANQLYRYQEKTKKIDSVFDPYQKIAFGVFDIAQTKSRQYFSVNGGFLSLDKLGNWQLHIPPGIDLSLPFTTCAGYGDYLFLGTGNGVIAYNEKIEKYDYFTAKEGLLSNDVNALYADSSYLWVATDRGISRFTYHRALP